MYSLKALFDKEPVAVAAALKVLVLAVAVFVPFSLDDVAVATIALAVEALLSLFVVRAKVTPTGS